MKILGKLFGPSPFADLHEHTKKVYECVILLRPLTEALLKEDYDKIEELHNQMSKTEHEADQIKTRLRDQISQWHFFSVGENELSQFLAYQDDVADAAEDYAVVLLIRKTRIPDELKEDFKAFVEQIIKVCEHLLAMAQKLTTLEATAFSGKEAEDVLEEVHKIGQEEWQADRMERSFARKFYSMEDKLDTITIIFLEKFCKTLSAVANNAEKTAKYLRLIIQKK